MNRRQFLQSGSAAALLALSGTRSIYGANDRIVVAGMWGREYRPGWEPQV